MYIVNKKGDAKMLVKKIVKRGDSHFVLVPRDLMKMLNLNMGDSVKIKIEKGVIILEPLPKK
jgi:antitoxin component of MazEF toxin-antitoxin module